MNRIDPNEPAMPYAWFDNQTTNCGLSIRAHIAAMAMQGILSGLAVDMETSKEQRKYWAAQHPGKTESECVAIESVGMADALIEALNK